MEQPIDEGGRGTHKKVPVLRDRAPGKVIAQEVEAHPATPVHHVHTELLALIKSVQSRWVGHDQLNEVLEGDPCERSGEVR